MERFAHILSLVRALTLCMLAVALSECIKYKELGTIDFDATCHNGKSWSFEDHDDW